MRKLFFIILFLPFIAMGQTRLYFSSTEAADVSPAFNTVGGVYVTTEAKYGKMNYTKGTSAITIGTQNGPWSGTANRGVVDVLYVSDSMTVGTTFTTGVTTFKAQLMVREYATTDNVDFLDMLVSIVSADGATVRVSYSTRSSSQLEFINNVSHRNQSIASGSLSGSTYVTVSGDRLCVQIMFRNLGSGTTPEASAKYGENATDLPEDNSQTTDGAPWIEFSNSITFVAPSAPSTKKLSALGVGLIIPFEKRISDDPYFIMDDHFNPAILPNRKRKYKTA